FDQRIINPRFGTHTVTVNGQTITGSGFGFYKDLRDLAARTFAATGQLLPEHVWPEAATALAEWGLSTTLAKHPELAAAAAGPTGTWTNLSAQARQAAAASSPTVVVNQTIANPLDAELVTQAVVDAIARGAI